MNKSSKLTIKKVVLLGSGGLRIGQAGEFDYSGSQAIKALKEENIYTVLINPNIATVQTDTDMADRVYFQPLNLEIVTKILERELPDAILLSCGGQTALNLGLALYDGGVLERLNIQVLGTPPAVIKTTEDRDLFKAALAEIDVSTARSSAASSVSEAVKAAAAIGYPVMIRSAYSLGGLGSGLVKNKAELVKKVSEVIQTVPQVLIEEYLLGWKEIEYEVVRDQSDNIITVCNMENLDPMGVHTGESIVVAPSQTLTNTEYHMLREVAIRTIRHLGIVGECNIQYALNPKTGDYRVIEVNARLSRSSALASKATGYPLAFVATKLCLGYRLHELKNTVTNTTSAFFEPALDYIAVKMPRWDLTKLKSSTRTIGTEMKSVGEVMALGRSFPEALQKAIRMLNIGADGLALHPHTFNNPANEIKDPTDRRIFAIYEALKAGESVKRLHRLSGIDPWFLEHIEQIRAVEKQISSKPLTNTVLLRAKQFGFSDKTIAALKNMNPEYIRKKRISSAIIPYFKQIDTLAGEFDATTNYLYSTYHAAAHDIKPLDTKSVLVLGSGPYCIGSSVEFDWCAVNTAKTFRAHGHPAIIINSNPETVSTDFDCSDRLYFEELTEERVRDIADYEQPGGIHVSVGGQIANNLAFQLGRRGYPLLGTAAENIDRAENRKKFSHMLGKLGVDQPSWREVTSLKVAKQFAEEVGYPVLIRPSYVLSGGAMKVVTTRKQMEAYLAQATKLSPDYPVVISQFIEGAKELEIDGVAKNGSLVIYAMSEHIENAGVHSGDATVVYPAQNLYLETVRRAKNITRKIIKELGITGPFNIQFIAKDNSLKVIECNVRASRSFPFVSKVSGYNFIKIAAEAMLGMTHSQVFQTFDLDHVGVKTAQFSYNRLKGADPVASVEMASTGEVACFGKNALEAFYRSWLATEQTIKNKHIFISLPDHAKPRYLEELDQLARAGWHLYATAGTHDFLSEHAVPSKKLFKIHERNKPDIVSAITKQKFGLIINIPSLKDTTDAYTIRRLAVDNHIPLFTNAETGRLMLQCLIEFKSGLPAPLAWNEYLPA